MAFNIKTTLSAIASHVSRTGYAGDVQIGEPVNAPEATDKVFAAIFMNSATVVELTLGTTIELHTVTLRIMKRAPIGAGDDSGAVVEELALVVSQVSSNLIGEFDLGGTIRAIDVGGQYGEGISATWGYATIAQTVFRVVDISLPLIVDDSGTQAA